MNEETALVILYNNLHLPHKTSLVNDMFPFCRAYGGQLMAEARDLYHGKGERESTYQWFEYWFEMDPILATHTMAHIIASVGCWKDIKYICERLPENHPAVIPLLQFLNNALLQCDQNHWIAKWVPREKSKFRRFYHFLAVDWNTRILKEPLTISLKQMYKKYRQSLALIQSRPELDHLKNGIRFFSDPYESLIQKAMLLSTTKATELEQSCIEKTWEKGRNETWIETLVILDLDVVPTEAWFQVVCRLIRNNSVPRSWVILNNRPIWMNWEGKTVVEIVTLLQEMISQKKTANACKTNGILEAVQQILGQMIPLFSQMPQKMKEKDSGDKMTWIILTDLSKHAHLPGWIEQMFCKNNAIVRGMKSFPHRVYLHASNQEYDRGIAFPRTTLFSLSRRGLTPLQWQHLQALNHDEKVRQQSPWETITSILSHYQENDFSQK